MGVLKKYVSITESDTDRIIDELRPLIKVGSIIQLNGNLGSGKTYFVKSFCRKLGIKNVSSPSFAIVNEYNSENVIYHFDFYRIKKIDELYDIGFNEYVSNENSIIFIEWAELYEEILPENTIKINFIINNDNTREITVLTND